MQNNLMEHKIFETSKTLSTSICIAKEIANQIATSIKKTINKKDDEIKPSDSHEA